MHLIFEQSLDAQKWSFSMRQHPNLTLKTLVTRDENKISWLQQAHK